ncbi:MAG: hypothetical protein FWF29_08420 [Treponema sp.]|nr:hypothetical protein [Treponema sp.]
MKKALLLIILAASIGGLAFSQTNSNTPKPSFDKPHSMVVDMWQYGRRYNDSIKTYSAIKQTQSLDFIYYGFNQKNKNWDVLGSATIKEFGDRDSTNIPDRILGQYRWFAIQSVDGIDFDISVRINSNDLNVTILGE